MIKALKIIMNYVLIYTLFAVIMSLIIGMPLSDTQELIFTDFKYSNIIFLSSFLFVYYNISIEKHVIIRHNQIFYQTYINKLLINTFFVFMGQLIASNFISLVFSGKSFITTNFISYFIYLIIFFIVMTISLIYSFILMLKMNSIVMPSLLLFILITLTSRLFMVSGVMPIIKLIFKPIISYKMFISTVQIYHIILYVFIFNILFFLGIYLLKVTLNRRDYY